MKSKRLYCWKCKKIIIYPKKYSKDRRCYRCGNWLKGVDER